MSYEYITVETRDRITRITINRPEVMNAIHPPTTAEMAQAFDDFHNDDEAWVAIVTGAGERAFSAGNDLKAAASGEAGVHQGNGGFAGITDRHDLFKPVIAAVNGLALGGGFEIALACDIILASDNATFGLPEPRVGFIAAAGGIHRLPRLIPIKRAMDMILRGKPIDALEAYRLGLVSKVVPQSELLATAEQYAREILECAPISVRASKEAAMTYLHAPVSEAMHAETPLMRQWQTSEDFKEGPKAFVEKRKPNWKGR